MRVEYVAVSRRRSGAPGLVVYRPGRVTFCCAAMRRWWGVLVSFGVRDCPASTSREVNLYHERPQANGKTVLEVVPIDYCPFCGENIVICRRK